jgi:hypothetical protein
MKFVIAACAAALLATSGVAQAAPIIDTGAGATSIGSAMTLADGRDLAGYIVFKNDVTITGIRGWLGGNEGGLVVAGIYSDIDFTPADQLYSTRFSIQDPVAWQGADSLNWTLKAGSYWVVFKGSLGPDSYMPGSAPNPLVAYKRGIDGSWGNLREQALGVQIDGVVGGAVPEPASWAMLIGGFGLAGGAIRTRRKRPVALA